VKLMFIINGLGTGGAERSTAEMLPFLVDAGVTPMVVCLYGRQEGIERNVVSNGFEVKTLTERNHVARIRELSRLISSRAPDVVHTTIFEANVVGRLAAYVAGRRPVITSLVSMPYGVSRRTDPRVRPTRLAVARTIESWTSRSLTTHFHAISSAVAREAVEQLKIPPAKISVIHRGRDPKRLGTADRERRRRVRRELGIGKHTPVVINVARQEYAKGQRHLIKAIPSVLTRHPETTFLIAGRKGHATDELERLLDELEIHESVRFLGHRDDVPDLLAAADLFVFPSIWEGLGGALIEAMALGLPIVASDLEAIREVVEDERNAALVPPGSSPDLANVMLEFLDDAQRRKRFGERSREIFEDRFTIEESTHRMIELYRQVTTNPKERLCASFM
jgi:glycosyltransferase involved in cell wall biosynthesis